jgi:hypothetical protein
VPKGREPRLLVDANGKTVGRFFPNLFNPGTGFRPYPFPYNGVMLQIQGIWVTLPVSDLASGFVSALPSDLAMYYQTNDCTGQAYMFVNDTLLGMTTPQLAVVFTVPPATAPSIYYAGTPSQITAQSGNTFGGSCAVYAGALPRLMGPVQSYPVSSLGFTLPFSIK